jgi:hypothetical protein
VGNQGDSHALGRWSPFTEAAIFITAAVTFLTRFICFEEALSSGGSDCRAATRQKGRRRYRSEANHHRIGGEYHHRPGHQRVMEAMVFLGAIPDKLRAHSALAEDAACLLGGPDSRGERIYRPGARRRHSQLQSGTRGCG